MRRNIVNGKTWRRLLAVTALLVLVLVIVQTAMAYAYFEYQNNLYAVAPKAAGQTDDGVAYDPWDVVVKEEGFWCDGTTEDGCIYGYEEWSYWWKVFDGENYGLGPKHKINAISIPEYDNGVGACAGPDCPEFSPPIYMTFVQTGIFVPGITPYKVNGQDVVLFTPAALPPLEDEEPLGSFEVVFDGSDVGLTTAAEKIDGLDVWPIHSGPTDVEFPYDCNAGVFFISTAGDYRVPAANGGTLFGRGSDVLVFCATNLGWDTAGFWFNSFDGVDNGVRPYNAINGLDVEGIDWWNPDEQVEEENMVLWFSFITKTAFTAPDVAGGPSEVFSAGPYVCEDGDCYYWFAGPHADFNEHEPALNGTALGYDYSYESDYYED
jgi:hypothetical protein